MPMISQEVFQLAAGGYGRAGRVAKGDKSIRPDLETILEHAIQYLRNLEHIVEQEMEGT
jgi:hypothetical protein